MSLSDYLKVPIVYSVLLFMFSLMSLFWGINFFLSDCVVFLEWEMVSLNSSVIIMTFLLDWMSLSFMGVVFLISSMVLMYCQEYMFGDENLSRFIILVFLFVMSMMFLILSPNMISILLGWDGLGLVSYCLVIYYQNIKSANAGMLTVLSNRIGDIAILLCISWMFNFGNWNFFYIQFMYTSFEVSVVMLLVIMAAMTKSAQIPFSAWLPAAMAAPTPVSALVHSSTLVTAGVYLLIRFSEVIGVSLFLLYISVFTMMMSGVGANLEMDLKKIIALSTLSQLGVMIMTLSLGLVELTFFHLISHALFKSLLFLCAGVYIHSYGDTQDIRLLGGASKVFPVTTLFFIGCSLSLCGFPFLSGFYSKDMIIESYYMSGMNIFIFIIILMSTMATITYSFRLIYYMCYKNLGVGRLFNSEESIIMLVPMSFLFMSSTLTGAGFSWVYLTPVVILLPLVLKLTILILGSIMVGLSSLMMSETAFIFKKIHSNLLYFLGMMWGLPVISTVYLIKPLDLGLKLLKYLDHGWLEELGGQGSFSKLSKTAPSLDSWNLLGVKSYLFMFFVVMLMVMLML